MHLRLAAYTLPCSQAMARNYRVGGDVLSALKDAAAARDEERLQFQTQQFLEHIGALAQHD